MTSTNTINALIVLRITVGGPSSGIFEICFRAALRAQPALAVEAARACEKEHIPAFPEILKWPVNSI
jgi:hypothetical protein